VPCLPEFFSGPAVERIKSERRREDRIALPCFAGLRAGEVDPLIRLFAGLPEVHQPVRGRIRGARAFEVFVTEANTWLDERNAAVEDVDLIISERRTIEEVVLHLDGEEGKVSLPVAIVADRQVDGRIEELRIYFSNWALSGRHVNRPPLLQRDTELREPLIVGAYQRALAAGDAEAIRAIFEPDGYVRESAGSDYVHRGSDGLRHFYDSLLSEGGIQLEHCTVTDDQRACALEYNVVGWGSTELPPQAGIAVYVRGKSGKLSAARIYDDSNPPLRASE
jgi:hypothetical protein